MQFFDVRESVPEICRENDRQEQQAKGRSRAGAEAEAVVAGQRSPARRRKLGPLLVVAGVIGAIALCEYVFAYRNVAHGIILSLALAILLSVFLAVQPRGSSLTACVESLTLIPLYILFTSSLPWFFIRQLYLLPAVYSCILGLCLLHINRRKIDLRELVGFPRTEKLARYLFWGAAIGICMGFGEYVILRPAPFYPEFTFKYFFVNLAWMLLFVGTGEELLFRGLIQRDLTRLVGWQGGLFFASLLFSVMHLTWRSLPELCFVFFAGLIFGALYLRTGSLILPVIAHGVNNTLLVAVYPFIFQM